jgi:hypothetical protein
MILFVVVFGLAIVTQILDVFPTPIAVNTFRESVDGPQWEGFVPHTQLKIHEISFQQGFSRVTDHLEQGRKRRPIVGILLQKLSTFVFYELFVGISKEKSFEFVDLCQGCRRRW